MTRPDISIATLEHIMSRQGHIPMLPSDLALFAACIMELRESTAALSSAARNRTEIVTDLDVISLARAGGFPGRSNVVPLRGRVGA
ncbi:hypothetical protein [Pseudoroseomonas cervicalis]|uniref:hypothetical protein n=1 Tax=Teichococcus cervicalis TaxID=204525 RepID=UPI00277E7363|nr:hypothetical protein [Pseudoroseomonas cervicalis]MDQ1077976.1 hypothetical protein [Pseudoroseomonas cervicalis]